MIQLIQLILNLKKKLLQSPKKMWILKIVPNSLLSVSVQKETVKKFYLETFRKKE